MHRRANGPARMGALRFRAGRPAGDEQQDPVAADNRPLQPMVERGMGAGQGVAVQIDG